MERAVIYAEIGIIFRIDGPEELQKFLGRDVTSAIQEMASLDWHNVASPKPVRKGLFLKRHYMQNEAPGYWHCICKKCGAQMERTLFWSDSVGKFREHIIETHRYSRKRLSNVVVNFDGFPGYQEKEGAFLLICEGKVTLGKAHFVPNPKAV